MFNSSKKISAEFIPPNKPVPMKLDLPFKSLKILHYLAPICSRDISLPLYLSDYLEDAKKLVEDGYFGEADISEFLNTKTAQELKDFLKSQNLAVSGVKSALIKRIVSNADASTVIDYFHISDYYSVTQKGKDIIKKYPRSILDNIEFEFLTNHISEDITEEILKEHLDFAQANIKFLDKYKKYDLSVKAFILALEKYSDSNNTLATRQIGRHSDIFARLYGVSIPDNVFRQVERFYRSLKELQKLQPLETKHFYEFYSIESMKDEKTCDYCKRMHGQKFHTKQAAIGINYPPFYLCTCDCCRCFITPIFQQ